MLARVLVGALCLLASRAASAQVGYDTSTVDGSMPLRALARTRGYAGLDAFRRSDFGQAKARLAEAFALVPAPSLGLWLARAQLQLGELSGAALVYARVLGLAPQEEEAAVQQSARHTAQSELDALLPRLSTLAFTVSGGDPAPGSLWVDDTSVDIHAFRVIVDPGEHLVRVRRGSQEARLSIEIGEAEHREAGVVFSSGSAAPAISVQVLGKGTLSVLARELAIATPSRSVPAAERLRAQALGDAGLAAYRAGQLESARGQLQEAFELLPVPVYALFAARAADAGGRLLEAISLYHRAARADTDARLAPAQNSYRREADAELRQRLTRLPLLRILLVDGLRAEVTLTLDGEPLESTAIGEEWAVDPGTHTLWARRGQETLKEVAVLGLGQRRDVILQFHEHAVTAQAPDVSPAASRSPE